MVWWKTVASVVSFLLGVGVSAPALAELNATWVDKAVAASQTSPTEDTYKSDKTAWADGYSRPDGEFINVEVTNANGDLDLGYVDFQGNLSKFIPLGNPRIFSVGSPASDVAKVELSKIDKSDMDAMSDLESMYAGFREGTAPDKDEWFSGYKLVIR